MPPIVRPPRGTPLASAAAVALALVSPLCAQEAVRVEALVRAPADTLVQGQERLPIPAAVWEELERRAAENEARAEQLYEQAGERLTRRNEASEERRREDEALYAQRRAERHTRREQSFAETRARAEANAERLRFQ